MIDNTVMDCLKSSRRTVDKKKINPVYIFLIHEYPCILFLYQNLCLSQIIVLITFRWIQKIRQRQYPAIYTG